MKKMRLFNTLLPCNKKIGQNRSKILYNIDVGLI